MSRELFSWMAIRINNNKNQQKNISEDVNCWIKRKGYSHLWCYFITKMENDWSSRIHTFRSLPNLFLFISCCYFLLFYELKNHHHHLLEDWGQQTRDEFKLGVVASPYPLVSTVERASLFFSSVLLMSESWNVEKKKKYTPYEKKRRRWCWWWGCWRRKRHKRNQNWLNTKKLKKKCSERRAECSGIERERKREKVETKTQLKTRTEEY